MLSADPWSARSRKLLRGDVSNVSVEETFSKRKRDRDLESVQTLSLAVREECVAQRRLSEADADTDIRNWERRNSEKALYETNRELESQRLDQANHWVDQAQREKIIFCGELEMENKLFRENCARDCQEIEELRKICCEDTDRARQLRIDELSMHQERNPTTVSQFLTQIQDSQNKVNSLSDAREFYDAETASSSGATHVPSQHSTNPSPGYFRKRF